MIAPVAMPQCAGAITARHPTIADGEVVLCAKVVGNLPQRPKHAAPYRAPSIRPHPVSDVGPYGTLTLAMAIEFRAPISDEDWKQHRFISAYAFNGDRGESASARADQFYQRSWALSAFDDGAMVAGLVIIPFEQWIEGAPIPLGGVASVSCLPERRREGHVGKLLRRSLEQMREQGMPLSALWTPHYSLYRRFGWEMAGRLITYQFPPKPTKTRIPNPPGSWRRVGADDWPTLDRLYREQFACRNGGLIRDERRWRHHVFTDYGQHPRDAAVWTDTQGRERGYVVYQSHNRPPGPDSPLGSLFLRVQDWVALDGNAYSAVLNYLLSHDLASRIMLMTSTDDPLPLTIEEPTHIVEPPGAWPGIMLRLVDVEAALKRRPAPRAADGLGFTIALTDDAAPWNAGTWRVETHGGRVSVEPTASVADLEMDARTLATLYNGYTHPSEAVRAGLIRVTDRSGIDAATAIFRTTWAPFTPDDF